MATERTGARSGARALARQAMKAQVSAMAFDLCVERGYDNTTVEDVCAVAGISRSTFFRYFTSKEDALLGDAADAGEHLLAALRARPDGEPVWDALRHALGALIERYAADPERGRQLTRLIHGAPALAAAHHEKHAGWYALLRPELARRLGADPSDALDPRPSALIGAALSCVDATLASWAEGDTGTSLEDVLHRAMGSINA
ncbi:TetR family transcriptional regulator [Streptomyces sp. CB09001]|uniref:acyl-CoA-like ligand-binding transcription factor n=1 Tax=Streptomyces sp. CB09001 TaxID=2083284 RepID=UPI001F07A4CF|nr:TetR family transcriptional regulator [Streptomyces sp. CB09001]